MRSTTIGWTLLTSLVVTAGLAVSATPARADIIAAYVEGHGGLGNNDAANRSSTSSGAGGGGLAPALGFQLGARLLIFEGYFDRTAFGAGVSVSRGILGLRAGLGSNDVRLILRGGGGVITEEGGALTGTTLGTASRDGLVARAGIAVEKRLAPGKLLGGLGLDGEVFSLVSPTPLTATTSPGLSGRTQGSDVFLSLYLKFELGI
jgi:hypothetical protein